VRETTLEERKKTLKRSSELQSGWRRQIQNDDNTTTPTVVTVTRNSVRWACTRVEKSQLWCNKEREGASELQSPWF